MLQNNTFDDDEFGGAVVTPAMLRAKIQQNDTTDEDEFVNAKVDIKELKNKTLNQNVTDLLELPNDWDEIGFDTEYLAITDQRTIPFCISLYSSNNCAEYLHPNSHPAKFPPIMVDVKRKMKLIGELQSLKVFKTPFVILDFLNDIYKIQWRPIKDLQRNRVKTLKMYFFFSFKDLELLWAKDTDFLYYCLQYLERIRRITTKFNKPIALPFEVLLPTQKGMKWHCLSIELIDICAMQGGKGLKTYLQNVGLPTDDKTVWNWEKNNNPLDFLIQKPKAFIPYIRGDVRYLKTVHDKTIEFYNDIASTVGVQPSNDWGLSTGKITARIASEWLAARPNVILPTQDNSENIKPLYWYNRLASPEAMKQLSHLVGNQALLYLGMTDGGRCVKERSTIDALDGVLVDIDINGCYGNGLKNQIFPIGNPSIIKFPINFSDWEKTYSKYLIPGLWVARISWKDAPFKQDLLLSKEEKAFTSWDWYQSHFAENNSDADKQYDASMYMSTNQVHMAAFNHDLYQIILNYTANSELAWIRENARIECFAYYDKRDEIDKVTPEMCEMKSIKELGLNGLTWCTKWARVELKDLAGTLIDRRATHKNKVKLYNKYFGKDNKDATANDIPERQVIDGIEFTKTDWLYQNSVQEFIKLIVNTIYGCIASSYFAGDGTGISNFIVGNNITARARTLAWCMAKGLYSLMSITDGGVFDVNKVAFYKAKSLDIFTNLGFENFKGSNRQRVVEIKALYSHNILQNESMFNILDKNNHVQDLAWQHLKQQFGELDIFKYDQFSFEVKKLYTESQIRNKSDYRLYNSVNGETNTKIRGLSKKNGKDGDDVAASIFEDIANGESDIHELITKRLLSLSEWREMNSEKRKMLLPHDEISDTKKFYSFTPLGCKFVNSKHRKDVMRLYNQLKQWERPELMEELRMLENVTDENEYKQIKKALKARNN
ncbi:hypothetical protein [Fischerella sp. PCC 9605]|uniref:hypothetical protein n=1 Tax=Fischerella sp. PCC 9605 TaxID=1173024 RepID=UPI00047C8BF1|nr:hypothetical protein [Fischerella sp. PCC 9605]